MSSILHQPPRAALAGSSASTYSSEHSFLENRRRNCVLQDNLISDDAIEYRDELPGEVVSRSEEFVVALRF